MSDPFVFNNKDVVLGVAPPSPKPHEDEFEILKPINPAQLTAKAQTFLQQYNVAKASDLASDAIYIVLGNPRYETARGLVVSDVLNQKIPGWGRVTGGKDTIAQAFGPNDTRVGLYLDSQEYVHKRDEGQNFFDYLTAATMSPMGILFNSHFKGYSSAAYHEVFHTFQGDQLTAQDIFKEGVVEYMSVLFAAQVFGLKLDFFPGYAQYIPDTEKLIAYIGLPNVVRAFFSDERQALELLAPLFYGPTAKTLPNTQRLSEIAMTAGKGVPVFSRSDLTGDFKMKAENSWYRKWVANNGGVVPKDGLALPVKQPTKPLGRLPPKKPASGGVEQPPLISSVHTPELSRGSGVPPVVTNPEVTSNSV
jgi:hypothetical protein